MLLLRCWEGGRELEEIVNYMLEQGKTGERFPPFLQNIIKLSPDWHASCWREDERKGERKRKGMKPKASQLELK